MTAPMIGIFVGVLLLGVIGYGLYVRSRAKAGAASLSTSTTSIGLVVHEGTPADMNRLLSISQAPRVRTPDYGDDLSYSRLQLFAANMIPVLNIITPLATPRVLTVETDIQIGNEPDAAVPGMTPEQYGATVRASIPALRRLVPTTSKIVTAGFSNSASLDWITRALTAGAKDADAVCFHVYGDDLVQALTARLAVMGQVMTAAGCTKPLWITEVGFTSADPMKQLAQLTAFLAYPLPPGIERVYVYALATDELTDFYGVCAHDTPRTPRPAYAAVRTAMAAHP